MRMIALLAGVALVAGCDLSTDNDIPRWEATLQARSGFPGVGGAAQVTTTSTTSTAVVTITGANPGATHPWHVHVGSCDTGGPIFGDPAAYPLLQPGADGSDTRTATIDVVLQTNQSYFVNVHASPDDLATTVACGNLVRD